MGLGRGAGPPSFDAIPGKSDVGPDRNRLVMHARSATPTSLPSVVGLLALLLPADGLAAPAEDALPDAKPIPRFQAVPIPHHQVSLRRDGEELARFHHGPDLDRPFFFPVRLADTPSLTRMGHPHDPAGHSHHNSVWISHNDVDGVTFWADGDRTDGGRIVTRRIEGFFDGDDAAGLTAAIEWRARSDGRTILSETRTITIRSVPGHAASGAGHADWMLVVDLAFSPAGRDPVTFGETPFGPIGVRMAKTIGVHDGGGRILNSEGAVNEEAVFRRPARWVDYSGPILPGRAAGLTLLDHPANPGHPNPFHVRDDGWMGACLTLDAPVTVARDDEPLRLRYGVWVHDGVPDRTAADAAWMAFAQLPAAEPGERR